MNRKTSPMYPDDDTEAPAGAGLQEQPGDPGQDAPAYGTTDVNPGSPGITGTVDEEADQYADKQQTLASSWLTGAYYDSSSQTLSLSTAAGRDYTLFGVPPNEFVNLMQAASPGNYFNQNLKGRY